MKSGTAAKLSQLWEFDIEGFVIDPRFVKENGDEVETRLALSFGANVTESPSGEFLVPSMQEGKFVFGLHVVAIVENKLAMADTWMNSYQLDTLNHDGSINMELAEQKARMILGAITDDEYKNLCGSYGEADEGGITYGRSDRCDISDFEIVSIETL